MDALLDPEFWARWLSIVVIDLTLAGDNALVIALAVRTLPLKQQWRGRVWGTAGAVALRLGWIVWIGGGILGYVAAQMMLADPALKGFLGEALETLDVLPTLLGMTMVGLGWWFAPKPASETFSGRSGARRDGDRLPPSGHPRR